MFKHILLPTDGSRFSERAVFCGIEMARQFGAKVTGIHAAPEFHVLSYRVAELSESREQFAADVLAHAQRYLDFVRATAAEARVRCETLMESSDHPHDAICQAATRLQCDLIVMASHGRRGLAGLLLGSETQRVLAHAEVPVLVWRASGEER
ncbi:universal stress protein [Pelomonas aquatica]|jgi:nucleotide-binding universal stress UspA family protein|uniref:Universal stress protein n=1 Tax=Pelomonas aquatica TaxID=431058 RepID=A0A9X4R5I8_9BURK|nr:universal stress protein [Pelomonas aquatica]MCY4756826.1 universal stress protein [Pelomonas aquatica]MDG0864462.1 universal stress protein [Pelomonas aquatica]